MLKLQAVKLNISFSACQFTLTQAVAVKIILMSIRGINNRNISLNYFNKVWGYKKKVSVQNGFANLAVAGGVCDDIFTLNATD